MVRFVLNHPITVNCNVISVVQLTVQKKQFVYAVNKYQNANNDFGIYVRTLYSPRNIMVLFSSTSVSLSDFLLIKI
jgi:hypothetical protein